MRTVKAELYKVKNSTHGVRQIRLDKIIKGEKDKVSITIKMK